MAVSPKLLLCNSISLGIHGYHSARADESLIMLRFSFVALYAWSGVLARFNRVHGRSETSHIDISTYCPEDVLHMGGPFFGDSDTIKATLADFLSQKICDDRQTIPKCRVCGYPDCECEACAAIITASSSKSKTKAKGSHSCALIHCAIQGAPPKLGYYDEEMASHLFLAWQSKGISEAPQFFKLPEGMSGYFWPDEMK